MKTGTMTPKKLYRLLATELNPLLPPDQQYPLFGPHEKWRYAVPTFFDERCMPILRDLNRRSNDLITVKRYKCLFEVSVTPRPVFGAIRNLLQRDPTVDQSLIYARLSNAGFKPGKPRYISASCTTIKIDRKEYAIDPRTENGSIVYLIREIIK